MKRFARAALMAGAAWSAMSVGALAQDAQPASDEATQVGDVIVTARRREEVLQDVPIAVTSLGAERLEQTGATDITALQQQTPNATVQVARGSNSTLISFIRGVGQQDPRWGFEPGIFQPVLPKNYIHRMVEGEKIFDFMEAWKAASRQAVAFKAFGLRQWFIESARELARQGYPLETRRGYLEKGFLLWKF